MTDSSITTTGDGAFGVIVASDGHVDLRNTAIETFGTAAHGFNIWPGGTANAIGVSVNTHGDFAHGITATAGAEVTAENVIVTTAGAQADGLNLSDTGASITMRGGSVYSANGVGIHGAAAEAGRVLLQDGAVIGSGTGIAIRAGASDDPALAGRLTSLTVEATGGVQIFGDAVVSTGGHSATLSLADNSYWQGAGDGVTSVGIDGTSHWTMTASSDIGALATDGTIEFDSANPYKTLTVGTLATNGGSFILNTQLNEGGAASQTDRIVVTGNASGEGILQIRNNGGTGAYTGTGATDGIQVVQVGGASDANFELGSAAVVGIYDYKLVKADGQNWYLQTEGQDPGNPIDPELPGGHVVDTVPGYNIALAAGREHVLTSLDTFHERVGELRAEEM
ncbi:autotransporter outer membrane beta-barrel domain-containing protein, partial [Pseudorhizobium xiangyangii]|uniref:autotransporter outer membrane beta-barrel domain-containing protein n=1 Tax=Pseudorhizobium xiangyangii TaxID=2883104 RepID=UPI001CFFCF7B